MAFTDYDKDEMIAPRYGARVQGLIERLPEPDAKALISLLSNPDLSYAAASRLIRAEAKSYPEIHPGWFEPAPETVRKYCMELRGL